MAPTYDFPGDDFIATQQELDQVRADLTAPYKRLQYSIELMEYWQRPEGYWLATSRAYPVSPAWSEQEQQEVAVSRERERDLTEVLLTHAFWSEVPEPERLDACSRLRHAPEREDGEGQETA
ncbi:nucleic acid-binding protein [Streptomyces nigra]|uniref:nucleic acid-binding protein n=1 Tax=Streptomyces nigra TaxID=1827580 RepID=UPI0036B24B1E